MYIKINAEDIVELITRGSIEATLRARDDEYDNAPVYIYFDKEKSDDDTRLPE